MTWTRDSSEDGFTGKRVVKYGGQYQLWWDGDKVATSAKKDLIVAQENGWAINPAGEGGERTAYNGKEFRTMPNIASPRDISISKGPPKFKLHDNWFDVVGWNERTALALAFAPVAEVRAVADVQSSLVEMPDGRLVRLHVAAKENPSGAQHGVFYVDPARGYNVVRYEAFDAKGQLYNEVELKLMLAEGGAWFPVEKLQRVLAPASGGKVTLQHLHRLDLEEGSRYHRHLRHRRSTSRSACTE